MADIISHGGDGTGDPPHLLPYRLHSSYESVPLSKGRGISRGINLEKVWQANGKRPLSITHTMQSIENNAKYFTRLVGTKSGSPYCLTTLHGQRFQRRSGHSYVASSRATLIFDKYRAVYITVDHPVADHYHDYKLKTHNHLKEHRLSRPYGELSVEEWQKCIDFFTNPTFVLRQMKRTIALLTANLQHTILRIVREDEEDENENNDESLEDL
ncbi:hypothetical protein Adt_31633 [Abeliophyllum distichum]|uniref:Uncharacterized protein n=1 Tax=Abeliophyllum distichum TaxID=126358 RepID=A0ABD1RG17_9LAMI